MLYCTGRAGERHLQFLVLDADSGQGWLVYGLTHSSFQLGLVGMARAVPMIVLLAEGGGQQTGCRASG